MNSAKSSQGPTHYPHFLFKQTRKGDSLRQPKMDSSAYTKENNGMLSAIQEFLVEEINSNDEATTATANSNETKVVTFSPSTDDRSKGVKVTEKRFEVDPENPNFQFGERAPVEPRLRLDRRNRPWYVLGTVLVGLAVMVGVSGMLYRASTKEGGENANAETSPTAKPDLPTEYYQGGGSGQNTEVLPLSPTSFPLESTPIDEHSVPTSTEEVIAVTQSPTPEPTPEPTLKPIAAELSTQTSKRPTPHSQQVSTSSPTSGPKPKPKQKTSKPSSRPTSAPISSPVADTVSLKEHKTFSFYVMGDVPYNRVEKIRLRDQLEDITDDAHEDNAVFIVHVGDIFTASEEECVADTYEEVADIFLKNSPLPTFVLPGDDDWANCEDPDTAFTHWSNTFLNFEENWSGVNRVPKRVKRQNEREENFALKYDEVLFLGLNIIGGEETSENAKEWDTRFQDCFDFAEEKINEQDDSLRAVIIFGHAFKFKKLLKMVAGVTEKMGVPSMYLHSDGQKWNFRQPFDDNNFWKIQVDQGGEAPPVKVTVYGTEKAPSDDSDSTTWFTIDDFISIDRRGGLYDEDSS